MKTPKLLVTPFKDGNLTKTSANGLLSINLRQVEEGLKLTRREDGSIGYGAAAKPIVVQMSNAGSLIDIIGDDFQEDFDLNAWLVEMDEEPMKAIIIETTEPAYEGHQPKTWEGVEMLTENGDNIYRQTRLFLVSDDIDHQRIQHVIASDPEEPQETEAQKKARLAKERQAALKTSRSSAR